MTTLDEEDSQRLLESLDSGASDEEMARRTERARAALKPLFEGEGKIVITTERVAPARSDHASQASTSKEP